MGDEFHHKMVLKYGLPDWLPEGWIYKKSRMKTKLIYGVGINDVEFSVKPTISGKQIIHPAYKTWQHMLQRAYSDKYKSTNLTYTGVEVCAEWLLFSNFLVWFKDNYVEGYQLDKDILVDGNKIYNPEACIFVPVFINSFVIMSNASRGSTPVGVTIHGERFRARIGKGFGLSGNKSLGVFDTAGEAHRAWQKAKLEQAIAFDFPALARIITKLKYHIDNNLTIEAL